MATTTERLAAQAQKQSWHVRLFRSESDPHEIRRLTGPDRASAAAQALGGEAVEGETRTDGGRLYRRGDWSAIVYPAHLMRLGNVDGRGEFLTGQ